MRRPEAISWNKILFARPFAIEQTWNLLKMIALHEGLENIVFETRFKTTGYTFIVGVPVSKVGIFEQMLDTAMPNSKLLAIKPREDRQPVNYTYDIDQTNSVLSLGQDVVGGISRAILASMNCLKYDYEEIVLQIVIGGTYSPQEIGRNIADPTRDSWLDGLLGFKREASYEMKMSMKARYEEYGFLADVRLGINTTTNDDIRAAQIKNNVAMGLRMVNTTGAKILIQNMKEKDNILLNAALLPKRNCLNLAVGEMVGLLTWPYGDMELPHLQNLHPQVLPPTRSMELYDSGRNFAVSTAEGKKCYLGTTEKNAVYHSYFLGGTGSGKTTAILSHIMADIDAGRGVFALDPKSDLVNDILARIPEHRKNDVVVIDPMSESPVGINPFAAIKDGADAGVVADGLLAVFQKVSGGAWGKRMEDILACSLLTLAKTENANLLMLPTLLTDEKFRQKITEPVIKNDPLGLGTFWRNYEAMSATERRQVIAPAMSRLRQFTLREPLRYILGQSNPKFNLNDLFNKNKIVLVSLNRGKVGSEIANLVGLTIISQVWSLTLARANTLPEHRNLVSVYIDEVQDYLNLPVSLEEALSQARAFGVGFHLANQYLAQLPKDLQSAIFANVGNWVVFGLNSPDDCAALAKFAGILEPEDFKYLPRYNVYYRTLDSGKAVWVSGKTLPKTVSRNRFEGSLAISEKLYGANRKDIDQDNLNRFNFEKDIAELITKTNFGLELEDEVEQ
jgi:hypothetical protein